MIWTVLYLLLGLVVGGWVANSVAGDLDGDWEDYAITGLLVLVFGLLWPVVLGLYVLGRASATVADAVRDRRFRSTYWRRW